MTTLVRCSEPALGIVLLAGIMLSACGEVPGAVEQPVVSVIVTPETVSFPAVGDTQQFTAAARDEDGNTLADTQCTWSSSDEAVASVTPSGVVTAVGNGTATITATAEGVSGTATVTVAQVIASVEITPASKTFTFVGETGQLTASALDANDNTVAGTAFSWSSSDEGVATVSASGLVTGVAEGSTTITATTDGVDGSATVIVSSAQSETIVADHHAAAAFGSIPTSRFQTVRDSYRIFYGHTSHGSQILRGLDMLSGENADYAAPEFHEVMDDLGHLGDVTWAATTRAFLDAHPGEYNVVMWSWCGGVANNTEEGIETYLNTMAQLETEYPDIVFIYMTGHLTTAARRANLQARNNQIRDFVTANNRVLFDFADIESYDPDGNYYPEATDACE